MIISNLILLFVVWLLPCSLPSKPTDPEFFRWGAGIVKDSAGLHRTELNFPKHVLPLYNEEGSVVGSLFPDSNSSKQADFWWLRACLHADSTIVPVTRDDCVEVTYEAANLKFYERKQTLIRVLHHTLPLARTYLKLGDLEAQGYEIIDWQQFIRDNPKMGWRRYEFLGSALTLRETPSRASAPILSFQGNLFVVEILGPWRASWVYVDIAHYSKFDMVLAPQDILHHYRGWIKALDESGCPNIWFATRD